MVLASPRFDDLEAPVDVLLAQELVNTKRPGDLPFDDLLEGVQSAQSWLSDVLSRSAHDTSVAARLAEGDLVELRELRGVVEAGLAHDGTQQRALRGTLQLAGREHGSVTVEPLGGSLAVWFEASLLAERMRAEIAGTWSRLKLCANPECRLAFYDRSRNRSAIWHSVERCGNKINLRNLRARRAASGYE